MSTRGAPNDRLTQTWVPATGLRSSRAMVGEVVWAIEHGRQLEEL